MILQRISDLNYLPQRIISLVPSQTELLYDLGLEKETAGVTKFCIHPSTWYKTKERVGGTKTIQLDKIHLLHPDLIIANKEENLKEKIELLALSYLVWLTDIHNLEEALQVIEDVGALTGKNERAHSLARQIMAGFDSLPKIQKPVKTAYLIWHKPFLTTGGDTFIHDMLLHCGFKNIFEDRIRYPETTITELQSANPQDAVRCQLLLLSPEPYPFKQKHIDELIEYLPETKIILVDGELFSWYGNRLLNAPEYFNKLINSILN